MPTFVALLLSPLAFAITKSETTAKLDAAQTFLDFEENVVELSELKIDSLSEFNSKRRQLENAFEKYCDSMKMYPSIKRQCEPRKKNANKQLNQRADFLAKTLKEDKQQAYADTLEEFNSRYVDLRGTQSNREVINPDILLQGRLALEKEILEYCPKAPRPELTKKCMRLARRLSSRLRQYEESIREGGFKEKPVSRRKFTNTTPVLRCFPRLPILRDPYRQYSISDPSGRYRYEHLIKTEFGYGLNVKLSKLRNRDVNNSLLIEKKFYDPKSAKSYEFSVSPVFSCAPGFATRPNCVVNSISISLAHEGEAEKRLSANAIVPITYDTTFSLSLPLDEDYIDEINVECVIASKIRKGGWVYSDEFFEEK